MPNTTTTTTYTTADTSAFNRYMDVKAGNDCETMAEAFKAGQAIVKRDIKDIKGWLTAISLTSKLHFVIGTEQNSMTSAKKLATKYGTCAKFDAAVNKYNADPANKRAITTIGGADRALLKQAKAKAASAGDVKDAAVKYLADKFTAAQIDAICAAAKASLK